MQSKPQSTITKLRTIDSPCVGICNIDYNTEEELCRGCGRTINEIAQWSILTDENKMLINEVATKRMKEISFDQGF